MYICTRTYIYVQMYSYTYIHMCSYIRNRTEWTTKAMCSGLGHGNCLDQQAVLRHDPICVCPCRVATCLVHLPWGSLGAATYHTYIGVREIHPSILGRLYQLTAIRVRQQGTDRVTLVLLLFSHYNHIALIRLSTIRDITLRYP